MATPFLRWAGAKRAMVPNLLRAVPAEYNRYVEPFLGSGALFFALEPKRAVLNDSLAPLVETYLAVRDDPAAVHAHVSEWRVDKESYYEVRSQSPKDRAARAARFIYLNKTCWNGLYRVNLRGEFNVPFGRPKSSNIVSQQTLEACSAALKRCESVGTGDFEQVLADCTPGDLVFLDPPYVTGHNNNGFIEYNEKLFTWNDQCRLAREVRRLRNLGAHVIVTNADHDAIRELYDGFELTSLTRHSTLAGDSSHRRKVSELVITSASWE